MKKIITVIAMVICLGTLLTACGSSAEDLVGTWYPVDEETGEVSHKDGITFYEGGNVTEDMGIFSDSYGTSYTVTDDQIQFVYYGSVEATATFDISGDRLELKLKKSGSSEEKTRILEKVQE